jgi:hypothetical protein
MKISAFEMADEARAGATAGLLLFDEAMAGSAAASCGDERRTGPDE